METPKQEPVVDHCGPVETPTSDWQQPSVQHPSWIEVLVDPRTLYGLMACGAGLLVLGLVAWLWAIGLFANKVVVASCLGVANFGVLALGLLGARYSRYQTASKAFTMLACLVMPLNLWFYDSQGLITLDQGGHLWVPALVCCALYSLVARITADSVYVNAIVGGVTMMGLLILGDHHVDRLWEIIAPSSFLIVLGMMCIHAERAFPPEPGRFSRNNFGLAFFNVGHAVFGVGLTVLLGGRLTGRLYAPFLSNFDWAVVPDVAVQTNLRLIAIGLVLSGTYTYFYSHLVVQAKARYLLCAVLTLVWVAIMVLDLLSIPLTLELLMLMAAGGAMVGNVTLRTSTNGGNKDRSAATATNSMLQSLQQSFRSIAGWLNYATLGLGLVVFARVRFLSGYWSWQVDYSALFVVAAFVGGVACLWNARLKDRSKAESSANWLVQSGVVLFTLAIDGGVVRLGFDLSLSVLLLEMLIPLCLAVLAMLTSIQQQRFRLALAAEISTCLFLLVGAGVAFGLIPSVPILISPVGLVAFFAVVSLSMGLSSRVTKRVLPAVIAALCFSIATWQLFLVLGITHNVFLMLTSIVGLLCLGIDRMARRKAEQASRLLEMGRWVGRLCISYGSVATLMIALSRLLTGEAVWQLLALLATQSAAALLAGYLSSESGWRRHFLVLGSLQLMMAVLVVNFLSELGFWQRAEMFVTAVGLGALALGYVGWYRENGQEEDLVSFNLAMGSFFSAVPLTIGMLLQRFDNHVAPWGWGLLHEAGVLTIGMLLLGAGVLCRIRWSTIVGGMTLSVYVVSLVGMIHLPEQLQTTAIYMMVGGGLFFGSAVLLSIYRDRLLAIPQRMHEGEGVFRVLKWR